MNKKAGKVLAVNISTEKGVPKTQVQEAEFVENYGIKGDAHAGGWHRQVSLLGKESIKKIEEMGIQGLCYGKFAENITTEGIELYKLPLGSKIKIGDVLLEVTQIGKECHKKCAIYHKAGDCVMPREGVFARVVKGGIIKAGDDIYIDDTKT